MTAARLRAPAMPSPIDFDAIDWGCLGKAVYPSRIQAQRALDRHGHRHVFAGRGAVKPYRCATCDRWHLGSSQL